MHKYLKNAANSRSTNLRYCKKFKVGDVKLIREI